MSNKKTISSVVSIVKNMPEFSQKVIVGDWAYSATRQVQFNNRKISQVISELRDLVTNFNGSEVQDTLIQKKQEFIQDLEDQAEAYFKHKENMLMAYKEITGSDYIMPAPTGTFDKTKTQAMADAKELLAKYSN